MLGDRRAARCLPFIVLAAAFGLSLCFRTAQPGFIPAETARNLITALRLSLAKLLRQPLYLQRFTIIENHPYYYETLIRLKNSLITMGSGMAVCLGGAVFQTLFKNPLASPNILGISTGVNLGNLVFVFIYTTQSMALMGRRYFYCYAFAIVLVLLSVGAGRIAGRHTGRFSIMDMLIVGSIISQFGGVFSLYLQFRLTEIDYELLSVYQELTMGIYVLTDAKSLALFAGGLLIGMLPVLLQRYRFNGLTLDEEKARTLGLSTGRVRAVGMICGGVMVMTALVHCGSLGILSMAVPMLCRNSGGADFRGVCVRSMCTGGVILLLCRSACSMVYVAGMALPVNFAISVLVLPVFAFAMSKQRRRSVET